LRIWHLVLRPESLAYAIAKALSHGGHDVTVCAVKPGFNKKVPDEIERRVGEIPRVSVVSRVQAEVPPVIDRLIVQVFPRPTDTLEAVGPLAKRARSITLVSAGDRSRSLRDALKVQWLEAKRLGLALRKIDRIVYKDGCYPRDLLGWMAPRSVVGFDAHSQYLHDPDLYRVIHARDWDPESPRPIRANFIGSQDPKVRTLILDSMRNLFTPHMGGGIGVPHGKSMLWREYSDAVPDALAPRDFVRILSSSDFTLCPRGYSLVTHRLIEAMLRGSIPVLAKGELDLYGFALEDGKNCIAVPSEGWTVAVKRLACMGEGEVVRMRRNIYDMFDRYLNYDALAKRIRSNLGVDNSN